MAYTPKKATADCPNGCGAYTVNADGYLRKHGTCARVPVGKLAAVPAERVRKSTRVDIELLRNQIMKDCELSQAMVRALHYYAAPAAVRDRVPRREQPTSMTHRALVTRHLAAQRTGKTELTKTGAELAAQLEPMPGTPHAIATHWRHSKVMIMDKPMPSNVVVPELADFIKLIKKYGDACATGSTAEEELRLRSIVAVLGTLYREAGR
jgi:hypothetical protein